MTCEELFYYYQYYQYRADYWEAMRQQDQATANDYMMQYDAQGCPPLAAPPVPGQESDDFKEFQAEVEALVQKFNNRHSKPGSV